MLCITLLFFGIHIERPHLYFHIQAFLKLNSLTLYYCREEYNVYLVYTNIRIYLFRLVRLLQRKARLWADTDVCKVVFVCNDRRTMEALQENKSYWGR